MASSGLRSVTIDELAQYADVGRRGLVEGLDYQAIRARLEQTYSVAAADGTVRRWLTSLSAGASSAEEGSAMEGFVSKTLAELEAYDAWARQRLRQELLTYGGLRRALQKEHAVTAPNGTMQAWFRDCFSRQRRPHSQFNYFR